MSTPISIRGGSSATELARARRLQRASRAAAALLVAGGALVLLGWWLDVQALRALGPVDVVMNPLSALLFVLGGSALLLDAGERRSPAVRAWGALCGTAVAASGAAVLMRPLLGWHSGIDELLFRSKVMEAAPPDWMAENAALGFLLLGLALLTRRAAPLGRWSPAHLLVLPAAFVSLLVIIGYLYHAAGLISFQLRLPMALNTAVLFLAASFAVVAAQPLQGATALVVSDSAGGRMTRSLLPALLLVPLLLGGLVNLGIRWEWYGASSGLALLTLATIVLSLVLTLATAGALHHSDRALRRSEGHFRALVENSSDYVMMFDRGGVVIYIGPSVETLLGYRPEEVLGKRPQDLVHPDDRAQVEAAVAAIFAAPGEVVRFTFRIRDASGSWRTFETFGRVLPGEPGGERGLANARDITPHQEVEEELRAAREEAERANSSKSEFLSRMSHELRTPMNSILGFAQLLEMEELKESQRHAVDRILAAGRHLLNLINEVLDIARIEANRQTFSLEPVRVAGVMRETLELIRPLAVQHDCRLNEVLSTEADCHVLADRQRLTQVLLNLLSNAVKYNRPGGGVCFLCRVPSAGGVPGRIAIGVRDTGRGIPPERMNELFTPFSRLGAEASGIEGTGLGLALSRKLVEAMDGELRAESDPEVGSTFWVELPEAACAGQQIRHGPDGQVGREPAFTLAAPATVLYVEDNLTNLDLVESIFATFPGLRLIPALQGQLGLELAREHHPDLVLLDLHLPDLSGETVLRSLWSDPRTRDIPVVIISADATPGRIGALREAGVREYLTKPLDVRRFLHTVESVLAERPASRLEAEPALAGGD